MYKLINTPAGLFAEIKGINTSTTMSVTDPVYLAWLEEGNTPEPADVLPAPTYQELRASAYPDFKDYLDGIAKGDLVQQQTYIDACLAVKDLYPKETL